MVKTPHTRHSKSSKEPVTIDLAPGEVSRLKAEAEAKNPARDSENPAQSKAEVSEPSSGQDDTATAATAGGKSAGTEGGQIRKADEQPAQATKPDAAKPASGEKPATSAAASASAGNANFGRKEPPSSPPPPPVQKRGSILPGAIAGGLVALVVAGGLSYSGLLPSNTVAPPQDNSALAALESELASLREQVSGLGAEGAGDAALAGRIEAVEQQAAGFASELDALRTEMAQAAGAPGEAGPALDLAPVDERLAALESALQEMRDGSSQQPAFDEQLDAFREEIAAIGEAQATAAGRLETLERSLGELTTRVDEAAESPSTAIIIAASALKAAIDRGAPFTTELETYSALNPDAPELGELGGMAAAGVSTRAQIAAESDAAANVMIAASRPVDPDAGILDRLAASAMGLVQVRPVGMVEGDGVPEIVARLDAAIQAGDYERALGEYENLPAEAKTAGEGFIAKVTARHAADRLVDAALAAALRS